MADEVQFDCLGFPLPEPCSDGHRQYLQQQISGPDEFIRIKHAENAWTKLSKAFNGGDCSIDQVYAEVHLMRKSIIAHGIPMSSRSKAYLLLANVTQKDLEEHKLLYASLVAEYFELPETNSFRKEIHQDLDRTFPQHEWFSDTPEALQALQRMLGAFALHRPLIGYCQSINFLAGFLLIIFKREEVPAFAVLLFLIDQILEGYHTRSLIRIMADMTVLGELIAERMPEVQAQFEKYHIGISIFAPNWFMSGFINLLPSPIVTHLWDWMLLDKDISVLFRMALGVLSMTESQILEATAANELVSSIMNIDLFNSPDVDLNTLILHVYNTVKRVPLSTFQDLREKSYVLQRQEFEEYQTKKEIVLLSRTTHFDKDQILKLKAKFGKLANEDGFITLKQLEDVLSRATITHNEPELVQLYMRIFDKKGSGMVEFTDIATGLSIIFQGTGPERLKMIFDVFDVDKSGYLERDEVCALLETIYTFYYDKKQHPDTDQVVIKLFKTLDVEGSDKLSFQSFQGALLLEPMLARCFVPQADNEDSVPPNDVFGILPIISQQEKEETIAKCNSRAEILAAMEKRDLTSDYVSQIGISAQPDSSCCVIS